MHRVTLTLSVEFDGVLNWVELSEYLDGALDAYIGDHYQALKYQNHTLEIDEEVKSG